MVLFHLTTTDSEFPQTPGKTKWFLPYQDLTNQYETISVVAIGFMNPIQTFMDGVNNVLSVTLTRDASSWTGTITIPPGTYTGVSLLTFLNDSFYALTGNLYSNWLGFNQDYLKYYVSAEVGHTRTITFNTIAANCYVNIGVIPGTTYTIPTTFTQSNYFTNPVNLHGSNYLDFVTNNFGASQQFNSSGITGILSRVPLDSPYGTYVVHEPRYPTPVTFLADHLSSIEISVLDENGSQVVFPPNWPITYTFNLDFIK